MERDHIISYHIMFASVLFRYVYIHEGACEHQLRTTVVAEFDFSSVNAVTIDLLVSCYCCCFCVRVIIVVVAFG